MADTNTEENGGHAAGFGYVFIAPNDVFTQPTMTIKLYDENGVQTGTDTVDIQTYYNTVDPANGRAISRTVKTLAGGTHSFGLFNTDENKGEYTAAKANVETALMTFGGYDYTLDGNVAYLIPFMEFQDKFLVESPLCVGV